MRSDTSPLDEEFAEAFKLFDQDNDGYITVDEAVAGFRNLGEEVSKNEV